MKQYKLLYSSKSRRILLNIEDMLDVNNIYHWINNRYEDCWEFYLYCNEDTIINLEDELNWYELYNYCIIDMEKQYDYKEMKAQNEKTKL